MLRKIHWQPVLVFFLFALLLGINTWLTATITPWDIGSDQMQFGNTIYKLLNPELYPRDFVFYTDEYTKFYTPSYIQTITALTRLTGDYYQGMAIVQGPLLFLYLCGIYLLYWQVTKSKFISVLFALLSIIGAAAQTDSWNLGSLTWMLARSFALPSIVLMFYLFFRSILEQEFTLRNWFLMGVLIGITANFHPTSGMGAALAVGLFALLQTLRSGKPGFSRIAVLVAGTILFGLPVVNHVLGNSTTTQTETYAEVDFAVFAEAFETFNFAYPLEVDYGRGWTVDAQVELFVRALWLVLSVPTWLLARRRPRSWPGLIFMLTQVVYIFLVVQNLPLLVFLILLAYVGLKWWQGADGLVWLALELAAALHFVGVFLPIIGRPIWLQFELVSITTIVQEWPRSSRLLTIPITVILAAASAELWAYLQLRRNATLAWIGVAVGLALVGVWFAYYYFYVVFQNALPLTSVFLGGELNLTIAFALLLTLLLWLLLRRRQIETLMVVGFGTAVLIGLLHLPLVNQEVPPIPSVDAALWARANTEIDTLFFVMPVWDRDRSLFRVFSQRNLVFNLKDLNTIGYGRPDELVYHYERYRRLESLRPATVIPAAEAEGADYLVVELSWLGSAALDLPIVYENTDFRIYRLTRVI